MKRLFAILGLGLVISIFLSNVFAFSNDCDDIRDKVFRLHILANSNTQQDQSLKLEVRDMILEESGELFSNSVSKKDAIEKATESLDDITELAQDFVSEKGYDYKVKAEICNMYFTTREYENFTLPAGYYDAFRVTIGEAEGKNWWCVLFPALCLGSATPEDNLEQEFTDNQIMIVTDKSPKYKVSFAIVEVIQSIAKWFTELW